MLTDASVITIDGPSGSGKGTISQLLAQKLGWHLLDSGALYRVLALAAQQHAIALDNAVALEVLAEHLDVQFIANNKGASLGIILEGTEVTEAIRSEECGRMASEIAIFSGVRHALISRQRAFRQLPGLVADGRDMGTVIFPDAVVKVFLTATPMERAKRRYEQLKKKSINVSLERVFDELNERDVRDKSRLVSPLLPAADAIIIDTSLLTLAQVFAQVLVAVNSKGAVKVT